MKEIYSAPLPMLMGSIDEIINLIQREKQIEYDRIQIEAIKKAIDSKIMVITSGPGTGKTTTVAGIISAFQSYGLKLLLCAPTGRAAKRLNETTGLEAKTIHRLLEYKPPEGYQRNTENPLKGDVLIIDESSMIDIVLMYNLLKAVPDSMRITIIGDANQLPSVGPGNVLSDIINSGAIPVIKLERIFRQAQGSAIIMNAHRVNRGEFINLNPGKNSDFFFIEEDDNSKLPALIAELCSKRLPNHYKVNPITGIQVLCPMQRGECGVENLNTVLQAALNKNTLSIQRGGKEHRAGDKVMQIKNNYEKLAFNGDIGIIEAINLEERSLRVRYDDTAIEYDYLDLDELTLAYATTIHKAQGSEFPIVVLALSMSHYKLLQRNLLYTGITRAKKILVVVGSKKAVWYALRNDTVIMRNTKLASYIN